MKRQSGFTLIELIIVIVILGILAVTAAPQFFNFGSDARASTVRGLEGSLNASSELVHARAQIGPQTDTTNEDEVRFVTVRSEGGTTGTNRVVLNGEYAEASREGILNAISLSSVSATGGDSADWYYNESTDNEIVFFPAGRDGKSDCSVTYSWDGAAGNSPSVEAVTTGC